MTMLLFKQASLFLFLTTSASATVPQSPPKTVFSTSALPHFDGWTPRPTTAPGGHELFRRAGALKTCAYIEGRRRYPLTCKTGYCGYNTDLSVFGCCDVASGPSVYNCHFQTTCYDYGAFCDAQCQVDRSAIYCDRAYPTCIKYTFRGEGLAALACGKFRTTLPVSATFKSRVPPAGASSSSYFPASSTPVATSYSNGGYSQPTGLTGSIAGVLGTTATTVNLGGFTTTQAVVGPNGPPPMQTQAGGAGAGARAPCRGAELVPLGALALLCGIA